MPKCSDLAAAGRFVAINYLPPASGRARRVVTSHPVVGSRSLPDRTSSPAARSASGWAAYVRHGAGTSTDPYLHATSRAPCCDGRRSRSPEPAMPCSRASNSRKPDLAVSFDYLLISIAWGSMCRRKPPLNRVAIDERLVDSLSRRPDERRRTIYPHSRPSAAFYLKPGVVAALLHADAPETARCDAR